MGCDPIGPRGIGGSEDAPGPLDTPCIGWLRPTVRPGETGEMDAFDCIDCTDCTDCTDCVWLSVSCVIPAGKPMKA